MDDRLAQVAAGLLLLCLSVLPHASAAGLATVPATSDREQCTQISRYALAARALAEARVERQVASAVLDRMMLADQRIALIAARVLDHAYREKNWPPRFADQVEAACLALRHSPAAVQAPHVPHPLQFQPAQTLPERRAM